MNQSQMYGGSTQEAQDSQGQSKFFEQASKRGVTSHKEKRGKETVVVLALNPCKHPPERLFSWFVGDILCVACCDCGAVLAGGAS